MLYINTRIKNLHICRGYQRIGENITKGVPDIHEAIDVGFANCFINGFCYSTNIWKFCPVNGVQFILYLLIVSLSFCFPCISATKK